MSVTSSSPESQRERTDCRMSPLRREYLIVYCIAGAASSTATVDRIAWFHVPKTGSSFANTLMHLANTSLPANAFIQTKAKDLKEMVREFPMDTWFRIKFWEPWRRSRHHGFGGIGDHTAISAAVHTQFAGHFFGLFRQPVNRAQSAYAYFCPSTECNYTFAAYSQRIVGTATKMLSGQQYGLACHVVPARREWPCRTKLLPDVETAVNRLNSFAFVGMTEDYPRSICLLHAMFPAAPCLAGEFKNTNPTDYHNSKLKTKGSATAANHFYPDEYDSRVWARAKEIYAIALTRYRITRARCKAICPGASDTFDQVAF